MKNGKSILVGAILLLSMSSWASGGTATSLTDYIGDYSIIKSEPAGCLGSIDEIKLETGNMPNTLKLTQSMNSVSVLQQLLAEYYINNESGYIQREGKFTQGPDGTAGWESWDEWQDNTINHLMHFITYDFIFSRQGAGVTLSLFGKHEVQADISYSKCQLLMKLKARH